MESIQREEKHKMCKLNFLKFPPQKNTKYSASVKNKHTSIVFDVLLCLFVFFGCVPNFVMNPINKSKKYISLQF